MKAGLLLMIVSIHPISTFSQTSFRGTVVDKKTKSGISYATVGLMKENIGTNTDEKGNFILFSKNKILHDSLIISCVGYEALKVSVDARTTIIHCELNTRDVFLKEAVISSKNNWEFITLNKISKCGDWGQVASFHQTQLAQYFQSPIENATLTDIRICTYSVPLFAENEFFRIRIYDIDTMTGGPSGDLCNETIEVKSKNKIINVNLEKYKITIPNKGFFVAIEWLKITCNEIKQKGRNPKNINTTYYPAIGMSKASAENGTAWLLNYYNLWYPLKRENASISATIKH